MRHTASVFLQGSGKILLFVLLVLSSTQLLFAQFGARRRYNSEWSEVECPIKDNLHLIHFLDDNRGWILSDSSGVLLGTHDGGTSWQIEDSLASGYYEVLTTTADGLLLIAGDKGRLWVRPIEGESFASRGALNESIAIYDIMPLPTGDNPNDYRLFASGATLESGKLRAWLARSDTRGRSWERLADDFSGRFVSSLARSSLGFVYAASEGSIYTSLTGSPSTWIDIYSTPGNGSTIRDLEIDPKENGGTIFGLATGHDGLVLTTFNGGRNWLHVDPFTTNRLRKALVLNTQVGWVVGDFTNDAGVCWKTDDRGANWLMKRLPFDNIGLHDIAATEDAIFVVGTGGTIYTMPR